MINLLGNILDSNEKQLKRLQPVVKRINALEPQFEALSDAELRAKTAEFRSRLEGDEDLDDILPEAFAAVREAARAISTSSSSAASCCIRARSPR
jgi:preprotein translocase subunit SecA